MSETNPPEHPDFGRTPEVIAVVDPDGLECAIAAGDVTDLPALRDWLAALPREAYGQVFIEVFAEMQIEPLEVPAHVSVTWLCREKREASPRPGIGRRRGEALAGAVEAWFDEWMWADADSVRHIELWMGARTSSVMQSYWAKLQRRLEKRWPGCAGGEARPPRRDPGFAGGCPEGCTRDC
ncbi:SIP domain-containing protein [Leucobacter sp. CSA2]|uniref:SIP domain-containing protein n=1 Tax=Leucobacter edaphi TaxID=2796472 RepID=A0A934QC25_9MICO|nr:SIP domain-containing protein [Leucobacter edaphi]